MGFPLSHPFVKLFEFYFYQPLLLATSFKEQRDEI